MSKLMHYQVFIAIVELGSIAKAALHLNITPAAVSKQLANFEQNLGVKLFNRSHKKLEITSSGERFYPACKQIMLDILTAESLLYQENQEIQGKLAISLPKVLARGPVIPIIADFIKQHPKLTLDLSFSDDLVDLHQDKIDFAFRLGKLTDSSSVIATPLIKTQLLACVTPSYLEQFGKPESLSNLANHRLILMSPLHGSQALKLFFQKQNIKPDLLPLHRSDDIEGIYQSVKANLGIGLLLDLSIQADLDAGELVPIFPELKPELPQKNLYLIFKKDQQSTLKQTAFKAHVRSRLEKIG